MSSLTPPIELVPVDIRMQSDRAMMAVLILVCLFSAALGRFCFLLQPFDYDASIFIYMGKMTLSGGRLCHDMVDNKFPTVGLMTSIIWRCCGTCWPAYIALQTFLSFVSAWMLSRTAARAAGEFARLPTLLFGIVCLNFTSVVFGGFQLETLLVLFNVIAASAGVDLILTRRPSAAFIAGLAAGCGAMLKPTGLGIIAAVFIINFIQNRRSFFIFAAMAGGLSLPVLTSLLYLHAADLLSDMPALYRQISTYASQSTLDAVQISKPIIVLTVLGFPIVIRGFVHRRERVDNASSSREVWTFATLWLAIETAGVIMQRRMYAYHFLPMVTPAALLFGMLPRQNRPGMLAAALVPIVLLSAIGARSFFLTTRPDPGRLPLSDYLASHTEAGDRVWADAWPRLMLETGLSPGARYPFTFLFCNSDSAGLEYSAVMLRDFDRLKPTYIAIPIPLTVRLEHQTKSILELNENPIRRANYLIGWHRIEQYTLEHYTLEAVVDNQAVYRRRGQ